jgi:hypothetical protein
MAESAIIEVDYPGLGFLAIANLSGFENLVAS